MSVDLCGGRLCCDVLNPLPLADVLGVRFIRLSPFASNRITLPGQQPRAFEELNLNLGTAGVVAGKSYDVFLCDGDLWLSGLGACLVLSPPWSSDLTRSVPLVLQDGDSGSGHVNAAEFQAPVAALSGMVAVAPLAALYVGTFRGTAPGQTEDSRARRYVYSAFNREQRPLYQHSRAAHNYDSQSPRPWGGDSNFNLDFVLGQPATIAFAFGGLMKSSAPGRFAGVFVSLDGIAAADDELGYYASTNADQYLSAGSGGRKLLPEGRHTLQMMQSANTLTPNVFDRAWLSASIWN